MPISAVHPAQARAAMEAVGRQVRKGLRSGQGDGTTFETMLECIQAGEMVLWAIHDSEKIKAVMVLSVPVHVTGRKLFVELIAGNDMAEWVDEAEQHLMDYRDIIGAQCIEASCRSGLAEMLKHRGWKQKAVIMEGPK